MQTRATRRESKAAAAPPTAEAVAAADAAAAALPLHVAADEGQVEVVLDEYNGVFAQLSEVLI